MITRRGLLLGATAMLGSAGVASGFSLPGGLFRPRRHGPPDQPVGLSHRPAAAHRHQHTGRLAGGRAG